MADPQAAVQLVCARKTRAMAGTVSNGASDRGLTRLGLGLCAKFHPELAVQGFVNATMPAADALPFAERAYAVGYTEPLFLGHIDSQASANALLSFAVNQGNHRAVLLLHKAAIGCGVHQRQRATA